MAHDLAGHLSDQHDLAERRTRLIGKVAKRWRAAAPEGFVCAAGITTSAPTIARLLRVVAGLPEGMVVLPGLATRVADLWAGVDLPAVRGFWVSIQDEGNHIPSDKKVVSASLANPAPTTTTTAPS